MRDEKSKKPITVKQDPENEIPTEIIAENIVKISDGFKKALSSGLKQKTIVLLIHDATGVGKPAIRTVLEVLPQLKELYVSRS